MQVYKSIEEFTNKKNAIVTIGTFDGMHVGHQKIMKRLKEIALLENGETVILTFFPHPRTVINSDENELKQINTLDEKIKLFEHFGIDHLIIHPFTQHFSRLTAIEFVRDILVNKIGTKKLITGYNHQFGRNREGSFEQLQEWSKLYHFPIEQIPEQDIHHIAVSSTKIRNALLRGDIRTANDFLGHDFSLTGKVVKGEQLGKKLGFPTANLFVQEKYKIIPADGIYAVNILYADKTYNGMLYIGNRPTLQGKEQRIEVNIFDFDKTVYDEILTVFLKEKIRDDMKFADTKALQQQMQKDKKSALKILMKTNNTD